MLLPATAVSDLAARIEAFAGALADALPGSVWPLRGDGEIGRARDPAGPVPVEVRDRAPDRGGTNPRRSGSVFGS